MTTRRMGLHDIDITAVNVPTGLTYDEQWDIRHLLNENIQNYVSSSEWENEIGWEFITRKGKVGKRILAHCHDRGYNKPNDAVISKISQSIRESENRNSEFRVDITSYFDWEDGEFGKGGSCWWGSGDYGHSRDTLSDAGGFGLRFYDARNHGTGRTWILPHREHNRIYLFNAYGDDVNLKTSSLILKALFPELLHDFIATHSHHFENYESIPYINDDKGTILHLRDDELEDYIELGLDVNYDGEYFNENASHCAHCGDAIGEDETYYHDGDDYCESCFNDLFFTCCKCDRTRDIDELITDDDGDPYCERCAERSLYHCTECGEWTGNGTSIGDNEYCESCAEDLGECAECGEVLSNDELDGDGYCQSCARDNAPKVSLYYSVDTHMIGYTGKFELLSKNVLPDDVPHSAIECPVCGALFTSNLYHHSELHIAECHANPVPTVPEGQCMMGLRYQTIGNGIEFYAV